MVPCEGIIDRMQISWQGLSCFEIKTKTASGEVMLVVDPYQNSTGLRFPRTLAASLVCVSHAQEDANNTEAITGKPFVVNTPGEYEVQGIFVFAQSAPTSAGVDHLILRFELERMHVAHLGALDRELTDEEMQSLENIDLLMLPVGGGRVMTPKVATRVISQLEPRVVIPMTYAIPNVKEKLLGLEAFFKELGACRREDANKYKVSRKDLPEEDMMVVVLER